MRSDCNPQLHSPTAAWWAAPSLSAKKWHAAIKESHHGCATARGRSPLLRDRQGQVATVARPPGARHQSPDRRARRSRSLFSPAIAGFAMRARGWAHHRSGAWCHRMLCHASPGGLTEAAPGAIVCFAMRAWGVPRKRRLGPSYALPCEPGEGPSEAAPGAVAGFATRACCGDDSCSLINWGRQGGARRRSAAPEAPAVPF